MDKNKFQRHHFHVSLVIFFLIITSFACNVLADETEQPTERPPTSVPVVADTPLPLPTVVSEPTEAIGPPSVGSETGEK